MPTEINRINMDLVTGLVLIGLAVYASGFFQSTKREREVARAIDPVTGNPAIVSPLNHAPYGDNLKTNQPVQDPQLKRIKPFDASATAILNTQQYLSDLATTWRTNYWDRNDNIFLDKDYSKGNWMNDYLSNGCKRY
jgi:hypothetical protein